MSLSNEHDVTQETLNLLKTVVGILKDFLLHNLHFEYFFDSAYLNTHLVKKVIGEFIIPLVVLFLYKSGHIEIAIHVFQKPCTGDDNPSRVFDSWMTMFPWEMVILVGVNGCAFDQLEQW